MFLPLASFLCSSSMSPSAYTSPSRNLTVVSHVTSCVCVCVCVCVCLLSHVQLFETAWNIACQAPLSMEFPRQEYWSKLSFPSPGDLPQPGIEPASLASPALASGFFTSPELKHHFLQVPFKGNFFLVAPFSSINIITDQEVTSLNVCSLSD